MIVAVSFLDFFIALKGKNIDLNKRGRETQKGCVYLFIAIIRFQILLNCF